MTLADTAARRTVTLDGGLATLLEAGGRDLNSALWSARLLKDDPFAVTEAHKAFFEAGAEIATTATYQASFEGFASLGLARGDAGRLMADSVRLAHVAREEVAPEGWIAASIGPYGAMLANGAEYRGDYGLTVGQLREWHQPRLEILAESDADVLALETIPCLAEVEALLSLVDGTGVPAWLSLTVDDGKTRAGEPVQQAFSMAADVAEIFAVGVNCCDPRHVRDAIRTAVSESLTIGIAYPNSGEIWDSATHSWMGDPSFDPGLVKSWIEAGAGIVGGCCRVTPEQIRQLAALVNT